MKPSVRVANEQPNQYPNPCISFLQEGEAPPRQVSKPQGQKYLAAASDWKVAADLKEALHFPHHIVHTQERPDIVIWPDTVKHVIIVELTVSQEGRLGFLLNTGRDRSQPTPINTQSPLTGQAWASRQSVHSNTQLGSLAPDRWLSLVLWWFRQRYTCLAGHR